MITQTKNYLKNMVGAALVAGVILGSFGCSRPTPLEDKVIYKEVQEEKIELQKSIFPDKFYAVERENILFVGHPIYAFQNKRAADVFVTYALYVDEETYNSSNVGDFLKKETKYRTKRRVIELNSEQILRKIKKLTKKDERGNEKYDR